MAQSTMTKLSIPSTLAAAVHAQQAILADAKAHRYSDSACFAVRLALDEALSNAIIHGNASNPDKFVQIEYAVTDERITICVTDQGKGFHPEEIPDPTLDENLERPHGRGVMLMRAYMTSVTFNERGNSVTLIKTRDCRLPER